MARFNLQEISKNRISYMYTATINLPRLWPDHLYTHTETMTSTKWPDHAPAWCVLCMPTPHETHESRFTAYVCSCTSCRHLIDSVHRLETSVDNAAESCCCVTYNMVMDQTRTDRAYIYCTYQRTSAQLRCIFTKKNIGSIMWQAQ